MDNEEREIGVICIAAPIFDSYGEAIAAMSLSGPSSRLTGRIDELANEIKKMAIELSMAIGYQVE